LSAALNDYAGRIIETGTNAAGRPLNAELEAVAAAAGEFGVLVYYWFSSVSRRALIWARTARSRWLIRQASRPSSMSSLSSILTSATLGFQR
jgi:hypothetical protein